MKKIITIGHGGYAEGVKQNLDMIVGVPENMYFIDLHKEDDLINLEKKINSLIKDFGNEEILFVCDLLGASPFRIAAMACVNNPNKYYTVAGINTMAFIELSMQSDDLSIEELANRAIETTKTAAVKFPE